MRLDQVLFDAKALGMEQTHVQLRGNHVRLGGDPCAHRQKAAVPSHHLDDEDAAMRKLMEISAQVDAHAAEPGWSPVSAYDPSTLPALLEILFSAPAPTLFPRSDLIAAFLTGIDGLSANGSVGEMLRLNLDTPATPAAQQKPLGVIDGDVAGFPNGRRPGDDVVDIALRVVMGVLLTTEQAPAGQLPFTDGAFIDASFFDDAFPYLRDPLPGSPQQ